MYLKTDRLPLSFHRFLSPAGRLCLLSSVWKLGRAAVYPTEMCFTPQRGVRTRSFRVTLVYKNRRFVVSIPLFSVKF